MALFRRCAVVVLYVLLGLSGNVLNARSATRSTTQPTCMMDFWGGVEYFCYRPTALSRVVKQMAFRPVDPRAAVGQVTGLSLSQVIIEKGKWDHPTRRGVGIDYIFGRSTDPLLPYPAAPHPKWVVVTQGRLVNSAVTPELTGGERRDSTDGNGNSVTRYNPWLLGGVILPHHHLGLLLASNVSAQAVERIAALMQQQDKQ